MAMSLIDTLYDVLSGVGGTLFGAAVTYAINFRRNRRLMQDADTARKIVEKMQRENERLMRVIKVKEDQILRTEKEIMRIRGKK